jgi:hypothetical protein
MTLLTNALQIINISIWVLSLLMSIGICVGLGGLVGMLLGWLISNSLDENIMKGGQVGRRAGNVLGFLVGAGLGSFEAVQATTFVTHMMGHFQWGRSSCHTSRYGRLWGVASPATRYAS